MLRSKKELKYAWEHDKLTIDEKNMAMMTIKELLLKYPEYKFIKTIRGMYLLVLWNPWDKYPWENLIIYTTKLGMKMLKPIIKYGLKEEAKKAQKILKELFEGQKG